MVLQSKLLSDNYLDYVKYTPWANIKRATFFLFISSLIIDRFLIFLLTHSADSLQ